jgi:hypothetical protein
MTNALKLLLNGKPDIHDKENLISMTITVPSTYRRQFTHERQLPNSTLNLFNLYNCSVLRVLAGSVAPVHLSFFKILFSSFFGEDKKSSPFGRTTQHTNGEFTHRVPSTGDPQSDGSLNKTARMKIRHDRQIYADRPDSIVFLPIDVNTSGRVYEDFVGRRIT